jgi:hypothetical protein
MIGLGAARATAVARIASIVAVTLVVTGIEMLVMMDLKPDLAHDPVLRFPCPVPVGIADGVMAIDSPPPIVASTPDAVAHALCLAGRRRVDDTDGRLRAPAPGG